jgi:TetR/AcrR family macrolide resistance operon transcriptional repressor
MARPQTVTDDDILLAAREVILRRGYDAFSLAEVAAEVGLSRAAVILRFKSTYALKLRLTTQMAEGFSQVIGALPVNRSGTGLLELAALIGEMIGSQKNLARFDMIYRGNLNDKKLAEIERKRTGVLLQAISDRMPKVAISHDSAVTAFMTHLGGSIQLWDSTRNKNCKAFLVERTKEWLTLANVPHEKRFIGKNRL